jgi:outer membrane receptor protein involved in Fe transport
MKYQHKYTKACAALLGMTSVAVASAQETNLVLEEVVVTAQKRTETLSDTPISVSVFTGEQIAEFGSFNFEDLSTLTSGLTITGSGFNTNIATRGLGTELNAAVSPRVAAYLDGTYVESSRSLFSGLYDMQQVELLRGPQGTLYGLAAPAGTITLRSQDPNLSEIDGNIRQTFTDRDGSNSQIGVSLPIIEDELGLRVAGLYDTNEHSDIENVTLGKDLENETKAFRAVLLWEPSDNFDLRLVYHDIEDDFDIDPVVKGNGFSFDDRTALGDFDSNMESDTELFVLETNYTFANDWVATFVGSHQENTVARFLDSDASSVQGREQFVDSPSEADVYEIRLASQGNDFWDWTIGGFYQDADTTTDVIATTYLFNPASGPIPLRAETTGPANLESEIWAVFSHNSIHLSDNGTLTVGLRYNEEDGFGEQPFTNEVFGLIGGQEVLFQTIEFDGILPEDQNIDDDAITGTLKYQHRFGDDFMAYVSYDRGWRAGAANVAGSPQPPEFGRIDSEDSENIELGFKWDLWQGRAVWNFALYYQIYDDFQYQSDGVEYRDESGAVGIASPVVNVDEAESYGFDTDISTFLMEGWLVRAALSYNTAELSDASDVPCNTGEPIGAEIWSFNTCDLTGDRAGNQPEWSGNLISEYWQGMESLGGSEWYVRGLVNAESEYYSFAERGELDGFTRLDLYLGLRSNNGTWDMNVWAKNLTDETAELKSNNLPEIPDNDNAVMVSSGLTQVSNQLAPRLYGVTFNYNF